MRAAAWAVGASWVAVAVVAAIAALPGTGRIAGGPEAGPAFGPPAPVGPEAAGIELISLRPPARGRLIDLRYTVRAPTRAAEVLDGEAFLVGPDGAVLRVPVTAKVGSLRPRPRRYDAGRVYYALFANTGGRLKPGAEVTVVLGGMQAAGVRVE